MKHTSLDILHRHVLEFTGRKSPELELVITPVVAVDKDTTVDVTATGETRVTVTVPVGGNTVTVTTPDGRTDKTEIGSGTIPEGRVVPEGLTMTAMFPPGMGRAGAITDMRPVGGWATERRTGSPVHGFVEGGEDS